MAKKRFVVEWTPWDAVKGAAVKRGMPEDGSPGDYIEVSDFDLIRAFPSFGLALRFAKQVRPEDTWNCPRIRRQFLNPNDHDDLGNRTDPHPEWETEATWEVFEDAADPIEAKPDWLEGAA